MPVPPCFDELRKAMAAWCPRIDRRGDPALSTPQPPDANSSNRASNLAGEA